jgi:hypothetical protein
MDNNPGEGTPTVLGILKDTITIIGGIAVISYAAGFLGRVDVYEGPNSDEAEG